MGVEKEAGEEEENDEPAAALLKFVVVAVVYFLEPVDMQQTRTETFLPMKDREDTFLFRL